MNAEARELTGALNQTPNGRKANGVLPPAITSFCEELVRLMQVKTGSQNWEHAQLRRVTGNADCFVMLRGFGIPAMAGLHEAHLIVTMEEINGRREVTAERAKERFHLTDREQAVIIYLLKGLTNKEIAGRMMISEQTVKEHVKHIMHKTHATTRTGVLSQVLLTPFGIPHSVQSDVARSEALEHA
jgi:DNA-binding CsgD family transcriptional regulator